MTTTKSDKVALVTGAGRGIGRAYAMRLAELGYAIAIVDQDLKSYLDSPSGVQPADSTIEEITAQGGQCLGFTADASNFRAMTSAAESILSQWGRIDVAVCNAGGGSADLSGGGASELTEHRLDEVVHRNLNSAVATCTAVVPVMRAQASGSIVTISSQAGIVAQRDGGYADYGLAKAAVIMYMRYLAQELGPIGIRVNCLAPGFIDTARVGAGMRRQGIETFSEQTALRRVGTVDDCADALEYLVSPLANYVTGQVLRVDGGLLRGAS